MLLQINEMNLHPFHNIKHKLLCWLKWFWTNSAILTADIDYLYGIWGKKTEFKPDSKYTIRTINGIFK